MGVKELIKSKSNEITKTNIDLNDDFVIRNDEIKSLDAEEIETRLLTYLLKIYKWDVNKVSKNLGQTSRNVYRKIKKYKLDKDNIV